MKRIDGVRINGVIVAVMCTALLVACGRDAGPGAEQGELGVFETERTDRLDTARQATPMTVTGCVTSAQGEFMLTQLSETPVGEPGRETAPTTGVGRPSTQSYRLVGADEQLREHVGEQVRVTGEAAPGQTATMRETTPDAPTAGTTGTPQAQQPRATEPGAGQPQVGATTETQLAAQELRVTSVMPTGDACPAGAGADVQR